MKQFEVWEIAVASTLSSVFMILFVTRAYYLQKRDGEPGNESMQQYLTYLLPIVFFGLIFVLQNRLDAIFPRLVLLTYIAMGQFMAIIAAQRLHAYLRDGAIDRFDRLMMNGAFGVFAAALIGFLFF